VIGGVISGDLALSVVSPDWAWADAPSNNGRVATNNRAAIEMVRIMTA
jgi:hypothetical protein